MYSKIELNAKKMVWTEEEWWKFTSREKTFFLIQFLRAKTNLGYVVFSSEKCHTNMHTLPVNMSQIVAFWEHG